MARPVTPRTNGEGLPPATSAAAPSAPALRTRERPAELAAFETAVVEFFVDAAELVGVPKSVAAIYGSIFASAAPLSFAEIEARLGLSKGSVSQGLKILREVGAVKEVSTKADRTELFSPDLEMRKLIERFLESRVQRQLSAGGDRVADLRRRVAAMPPAEQSTLQGRVKKLEQWHSRTRALLPLVRTFLKLGS